MNRMVRLPETPQGELARALSLVKDKLSACLSFAQWAIGSLVLSGHTGAVMSGFISTDGTKALTSSFDGTIKVWDTETGALLLTMAGHANWVFEAIYSPDADFIASRSVDGTVKLWNAETGAELHSFTSGSVADAIAFSPDGTLLAVASGKTHIIDVGTWTATEMGGGEFRSVSVAFAPDGATLTAVGGAPMMDVLRSWDVATAAQTASVGLSATGSEAVYSPDGAFIAVRFSALQSWKMFTADTLQLAFTSAESGVLSCFAFSQDGAFMITGGQDSKARLWDASDGTLIRTFSGHSGVVLAVEFSPDGATLLTGSGDNTARLWSVADGALIAILAWHASDLTAAHFSADGTQVITASQDNTARIWTAAVVDPEDCIYLLHGPECAPGQALGRYAILQPDTDLRVDKIALSNPGALAMTGSVVIHFAQRVTPADLQPSEALETVWHNASVIVNELLGDAAFQAAKPDEISMSDESDPDPFVAVRVSVTLAPIEPEESL